MAVKGDSNTKYFHNTIRARRRKEQIHTNKVKQGKWMEGNNNISEAIIDYFIQMFTKHRREINLDFIKGYDNLICNGDNIHLSSILLKRRLRWSLTLWILTGVVQIGSMVTSSNSLGISSNIR
ncbi:hypothetical protein HAX54_016809 [Datura stramonium]|uniref:Uncharacterized protein n=1 Tax=Datura stramonium TaxID=4076 RepID=A0ABS8UJK7_DATST|nr:hypothetical protein [Datura stramonium]